MMENLNIDIQKLKIHLTIYFKYLMNQHFLLLFAVHILFIFKSISMSFIFPLHTYKHWGRTTARALSPDITNVYGNSSSLNYYYINVYIGNPPQKQALIIDTGSVTTALPCMPLCQSCGQHINSYYQLQYSNTSRVFTCQEPKCKEIPGGSCDADQKCSFHKAYAEGSSLSGVYFEDIVRFGDNFHKFEPSMISLGCTTIENNLFFNQEVDGIMGLGLGYYTFVNQLYNNHVISSMLFTLCLAQNGGYFSLGEVNSTLHSGNIEYIPFTSTGLYIVQLVGIAVDQEAITYDQKYSAIIDSGTTISYFPQDIFTKIEDQLQRYCSQPNRCMGELLPKSEFGICYKLLENINTRQFIESLPSLTFVFENGTKYEWPPQNYVFNLTGIPLDNGNNPIEGFVYCMGFNVATSGQFLLGTTWMHNHDIIFDLERNRIGLVESNCGDMATLIPHTLEDGTCENHLKFYSQIIILVLLVIVLVLFYAIYRARKRHHALIMTENVELAKNEVQARQMIQDLESRDNI